MPRPADADSILAAMSGRGVRPEHVLAVSARLDDVRGSDMAVLSVEVWPSCFDVHVASSSRWPIGGGSPFFGRRQWLLAEDDLRGRYVGTYRGGSGGLTSTLDFSFAPTLDQSARALTLDFPNPFDGSERVRTTVDLPAH
jgi:hypothetical protein